MLALLSKHIVTACEKNPQVESEKYDTSSYCQGAAGREIKSKYVAWVMQTLAT
jgi:hypothetical protein